MKNLINLVVLLGLSLLATFLFEKKNFFIAGIVFDLAAIGFILFHHNWWGEMLNYFNVFSILTQRMTIGQMIEGFLTWLASFMLILSPMCSPIADDWVEKKDSIK